MLRRPKRKKFFRLFQKPHCTYETVYLRAYHTNTNAPNTKRKLPYVHPDRITQKIVVENTVAKTRTRNKYSKH